jgi:hypothetical protein
MAYVSNMFFITVSNVLCPQVFFTMGSRPAGTYSIALSNLVLGDPFPAGPLRDLSPPFSVIVADNLPGSTSYPGARFTVTGSFVSHQFSAIGGAVTGTTLTVAAADRAGAASNRKVVVSFSTSTALVCGDTVTITFPSTFLASPILYNGRFQSIASISGISGDVAVTDQGVNQQTPGPLRPSQDLMYVAFIITVSGDVPAGSQTVTLCGLSLNLFPTNQPCGVSVRTNRDWTTTFAPTGTIGNAATLTVSGVSLDIPWANRVASRSSQTAIFKFTTSAQVSAGSSITLSFPPNFFVMNSISNCGSQDQVIATGIPGYSFTGAGPTTSSSFVLSGTASLPAGSYVVTFSGVTYGTATEGSDSGISVTINGQVSSAAPSGPLSGYQVTAFSMPTCVASLGQTCSSASLSFLSNAAPIAAGSSLTISFSGGSAPISGTPAPFTTSNGAIVSGSFSGLCRLFSPS